MGQNQSRETGWHKESNDALYCIPYVFFSKEQESPWLSGLNSLNIYKIFDVKWRCMFDKLPDREKNKSHRDSCFEWKNLKQTVLAGGGIDSVAKQIQTEIRKKKTVLHRNQDVKLHMASKKLHFADKTKVLNGVHHGNFLKRLSHF